mgnify:CR=1 FL=1|jgi:hypothetical protein
MRAAFLTCVIASVSAQTRVEHELVDRPAIDSATRCAFVDTSLVFERDGTVVSWDIFASRTGRLSLQVYRPTQTDGGVSTYQVVCDSLIKAKTADVIVHYELAADDRCNVQAGDVIGTLHAAPLFPLPLSSRYRSDKSSWRRLVPSGSWDYRLCRRGRWSGHVELSNPTAGARRRHRLFGRRSAHLLYRCHRQLRRVVCRG